MLFTTIIWSSALLSDSLSYRITWLTPMLSHNLPLYSMAQLFGRTVSQYDKLRKRNAFLEQYRRSVLSPTFSLYRPSHVITVTHTLTHSFFHMHDYLYCFEESLCSLTVLKNLTVLVKLLRILLTNTRQPNGQIMSPGGVVQRPLLQEVATERTPIYSRY